MGKVFKALNRAAESTEQTVEVEQPIEVDLPEKLVRPAPVRVAPLKPVATPASPPGQWDDRLLQATTVTGPVAESIRALRTRILHPQAGSPPRSLLVTSASPGEGKSFICANLAISLAQGIENHCVLVDCDLRRSSQHILFGLGEKPGLAEYLQNKQQLPELFVPSGIDKLSVLTAGYRTINPAELLGSSSMTHLIDELVQRYDDRIILLDSPPLHAASETAILAQHVDGVVLVVRYGISRREQVKALADAIGREKIVGVVFNAYRTNVLDTKVFGSYEYQQNYYYSEK